MYEIVGTNNTKEEEEILEEMCRNVINDMNAYGVCVLDNFLGKNKGKSVLGEVLDMYTKGVFENGQLVSRTGREDQVRGDKIVWIDGRETYCQNIGHLISRVDAVIMRANKMLNNGKLGSYNINGRTKVTKIFASLLVCFLILNSRLNVYFNSISFSKSIFNV